MQKRDFISRNPDFISALDEDIRHDRRHDSSSRILWLLSGVWCEGSFA